MPISLSQVIMLLGCVILLMVTVDWALNKFKKDWAPLPWELKEEEARGRRNHSPTAGER